MRFVFNDGGRQAAGFKGTARDCVVRAVAIAARLPYAEVYAALADVNARTMRTIAGKRLSMARSAREGVITKGKPFKGYMAGLGFAWVPTMQIGSGCKVHLTNGELPPGRLVVAVSRHYVAVIDGVIYDTFDPQRKVVWYTRGQPDRISERCVYGYWIKGTDAD